MQSLPWYLTAIGAALIWGIHYPLVEESLRRVSLATVLAATVLPFVFVIPLLWGHISADVRALAAASWAERLPVLLIPITTLGATILLYISIRGANATLASLIEITYPIFVSLFAYLLFRQHELTPGVAIGGLLILAGAATVIVSGG
jgi:drug/metabolite transporter (DMT)-like permease